MFLLIIIVYFCLQTHQECTLKISPHKKCKGKISLNEFNKCNCQWHLCYCFNEADSNFKIRGWQVSEVRYGTESNNLRTARKLSGQLFSHRKYIFRSAWCGTAFVMMKISRTHTCIEGLDFMLCTKLPSFCCFYVPIPVKVVFHGADYYLIHLFSLSLSWEINK